jgi:hypothetical protein
MKVKGKKESAVRSDGHNSLSTEAVEAGNEKSGLFLQSNLALGVSAAMTSRAVLQHHFLATVLAVVLIGVCSPRA